MKTMSISVIEENAVEVVEPYSMHVSARYLELTKRKLELTRLPREATPPKHHLWDYGTPKSLLEPLIDFWLERYDWRAQEASLNNRLPQFRTTITLPNQISDTETKRTFRVHFVHKRCQNRNSIPLLFCHGWPGSFLEVSKIIGGLTEPDLTALSPGARMPLGFHVVAPSIPGFGFSDASNEDGFGLEETADVFEALMRQLGYLEYVAHGSEWGFKICRLLSLRHQRSCLAVHTISPDIPPPTLQGSFLTAVKYQIARVSNARVPQLSFGYMPIDLCPRKSNPESPSADLRTLTSAFCERPHTRAYSLCDSPVGLLAVILDILQPSNLYIPPKPTPQLDRTSSTDNVRRATTEPFMESIPESIASLPPPPLWTPADVLNWTMMLWLPGPEAALRWLWQARNNEEVDGKLWREWSTTPLGISTFRTQEPSKSQEGGPSAAPSRTQTEDETESPKKEERRPWYRLPIDYFTGSTLMGDKEAQAKAISTTTARTMGETWSRPLGAPPMWTSAHQKLEWIRRHNSASRVPVWEAADQVVLDMRDCFADLMEKRLIIFKGMA